MALVDDFEPAFKLQGILVAAEMLDRVDASLLKRTGLGTLLLKVSCFFGGMSDFSRSDLGSLHLLISLIVSIKRNDFSL